VITTAGKISRESTSEPLPELVLHLEEEDSMNLRSEAVPRTTQGCSCSLARIQIMPRTSPVV